MTNKKLLEEFWAEEKRPAILDLAARGLLLVSVFDGEVYLFLIS
jgi:hypothetical protein